MKNIKIDGVVFKVEDTVFLLFEKLELKSKDSLSRLETETTAHLKCFNRSQKYKDMLIEIVDTLKDNYILGDDPLYNTLLEIENATK